MNYIITYTKTKFYPLNPDKSHIKIEDIAHAMSLLTRANGHFKHFYSVAQHSINCYKEAKSRGYSTRVQLGCLLHDASESYISDLTRPVKNKLTDYLIIEEKLQSQIFEKFGLGDLSKEELSYIEEIDDSILYFEFQSLMDMEIFDNPPVKTIDHDFSQRNFQEVKNEYIAIFNKLTRGNEAFNCVGIDGCKSGWIAVNLSTSNFEVRLYKDISEVMKRYEDSSIVLIDIPIGLPESIKDKRPDDAVRKMLKGKASSIFNTPCRQAVYSNAYNMANDINRQVMGKGLSAQSFGISKKIREVDEFLDESPQFKNKLIESHPEFCFKVMNKGEPIYESKKTDEGMKKRIALLNQYHSQTEEIISFAKNNAKLSKLMDDVVDALCLAIMGKIIIQMGIRTIPEHPTMDERKILMQMVYGNI